MQPTEQERIARLLQGIIFSASKLQEHNAHKSLGQKQKDWLTLIEDDIDDCLKHAIRGMGSEQIGRALADFVASASVDVKVKSKTSGQEPNTRTIRPPANYKPVQDEFQMHFLRLKLEKMGLTYKRIDWK